MEESSHMEYWERLRRGDPTVLEELYSTYYIGLMNYGIKLTGDRQLSNDCITQVLLHLWDKRTELPIIRHPRNYLLTCLRRELWMEMRSETRRASVHNKHQRNEADYEPSYEECIVSLQHQADLKSRLTGALSHLTAREKELLQLKFFEDLDYETIARRCGITRRTAYNILHGALKTLREELSETASPAVRFIQVGTLIMWSILLLENFSK